jgi:hypothetical protein
VVSSPVPGRHVRISEVSSPVLSSLALARVAIATESGRASLVGVRMHVVGVDEAMMALAHWAFRRVEKPADFG